ncbi:hypothetical protein F3Y22_tig00112443pilonHSYRG00051 [Hibiscus syriacus]|uniref:Uncharacterized protein n=1 Tax=Hibiscus syriacus TaxID=106335 RepID=A0A6A2Y9T7_HIBSY|nr:hypothetical protein F3Y22_tig00112443pilonHSYRG00051 [Hibiscus syriacus]
MTDRVYPSSKQPANGADAANPSFPATKAQRYGAARPLYRPQTKPIVAHVVVPVAFDHRGYPHPSPLSRRIRRDRVRPLPSPSPHLHRLLPQSLDVQRNVVFQTHHRHQPRPTAKNSMMLRWEIKGWSEDKNGLPLKITQHESESEDGRFEDAEDRG